MTGPRPTGWLTARQDFGARSIGESEVGRDSDPNLRSLCASWMRKLTTRRMAAALRRSEKRMAKRVKWIPREEMT